MNCRKINILNLSFSYGMIIIHMDKTHTKFLLKEECNPYVFTENACVFMCSQTSVTSCMVNMKLYTRVLTMDGMLLPACIRKTCLMIFFCTMPVRCFCFPARRLHLGTVLFQDEDVMDRHNIDNACIILSMQDRSMLLYTVHLHCYCG